MAQRAPFVSLWARDDVRAAVCDFLPTKTIAVLPVVAEPLRALQTSLLVTAIRRRGKTTVPTPQTTRALLDALLVGEPQYFCEKWERGVEQWSRDAPRYTVFAQPYQGAYCLNLTRHGTADGSYGNNHRGISNRFHGENLLVTRLRVKMSFVEFERSGAAGYVLLCGPGVQPGDQAIGDFMGGPMFNDTVGGSISLVWLAGRMGNSRTLIRDANPETIYEVDALIHHKSATSGVGRVDVSVNGLLVVQNKKFFYRPLSSLHLYNYAPGTSKIGEIEVCYEKAAPNQAWADELESSESSDSESEAESSDG
jgi:hypothetical protein